MESSKVFTNLKDFNKEYKELRKKIIVRHGYSVNSKVKLVNAVMLWVDFGTGFIKCTSNMSDMKDKIKLYELSGKEYKFMLKALV